MNPRLMTMTTACTYTQDSVSLRQQNLLPGLNDLEQAIEVVLRGARSLAET